MRLILNFFFYLLFITILMGCTQQIDYNPSGSSTSTGNATSNPKNPSNTPVSPTGDTSIWHPAVVNDSALYKLVVNYTVLTPCATSNAVVSFSLTGVNIPTNDSIEWYFGDTNSQITSSTTVTNTYNYVGQSYILVLKLDTGIHRTNIATITMKITIPAATALSPVATFTAQQNGVTAKGYNYSFNAGNSSVVTGTITEYYWTFGDKSVPVDTISSYVTHNYSQISTLQKDTVTLTVTSSLGCQSSVYKIVTIPN